jgi:limonene-1,2-epoxide hydrolase
VSTDAEKVVRGFFERTGEGGKIIAALEEFTTEDFVWENSGLPSAHSRAEAIGMMQQFIDGFNMHALVVDILHLSAHGNSVLTERVDHMDTADGTRLLSFPLAGVLDVVDGRITSWRDYFDPRPLLPPA